MIILLVCILLLSIIVNIFLYKALFAQLKKIGLYEQLISDFNQWTDSITDMARITYLKMKRVDEKGLFFKDDDVGFVFQELLNLIKKLNERINP